MNSIFVSNVGIIRLPAFDAIMIPGIIYIRIYNASRTVARETLVDYFFL
jgi:hypothetical protein